MKTPHFRSFVLMAAVVITLSATQSATAQRRGGRGGGRGAITRLQLVSVEKVQAELKLSDEQKKLATEITAEVREELRDLFQSLRDGGGDRGAFVEKMSKLNSEATAKLTAKLDDAQKKRLTEVFVQRHELAKR